MTEYASSCIDDLVLFYLVLEGNDQALVKYQYKNDFLSRAGEVKSICTAKYPSTGDRQEPKEEREPAHTQVLSAEERQELEFLLL